MHKFIPKKLLCIPSSWKPCKVLYTNKLLLSLIYFDSTFFIGWKLICFLLQFSLLFLKSWSWPKLQSKISFIAKKKKHLEVSRCILLENPTDSKNTLFLLEIMINISICTTVKKRFLKSNTEKTSLYTSMNSQTLSDVMQVGISSTSLKEFDPDCFS